MKGNAMNVKLFVLLGALSLTGCATKDYALYAETQQKIAQANAMAETARYAALAEIAKQGDSAAKVAAVMSLNMGNNNSGPRVQNINPPVSFGDRALQWTSVLLPTLTNLYGINANRQVAITQSNNQAAIAQSTNSTFASMNANQATSSTAIANAGLTAATTIANNGLTATTTTAANGLTATQNIATAGITGVVTTAANGLNATTDVAKAGMTGIVTSGANGLTAAANISTSANTAVTNVSNAANSSIQNLSSQIPNLQPNVTTTTTTTNNTTTNNNNLTCPAGKTLVNGSCV